jgi:tRNA (mo5U34)-methyltransferase
MLPGSPDVLKGLQKQIDKLWWYHTIDLGHGIVTPGVYDHRPLLRYYGIPESLAGKTVLDIGTASGFFAFEFERRGASVVATDLPHADHDLSPSYRKQLSASSQTSAQRSGEKLEPNLQDPFLLAKEVLGSQVMKKEINIYAISPETVGQFDVVFCGSLLLHLTDPLRAMFSIRKVTKELAIIATMIDPAPSKQPRALFLGGAEGISWWAPNLDCLVQMAKSAGFREVQIVSTFNLMSMDQQASTPHAVIKAWVDWPKPDMGTATAIKLSEQDSLEAVAPTWWSLLGRAWGIWHKRGARFSVALMKNYARRLLIRWIVVAKRKLDLVEARLSDRWSV